jgi:hypothetical protein
MGAIITEIKHLKAPKAIKMQKQYHLPGGQKNCRTSTTSQLAIFFLQNQHHLPAGKKIFAEPAPPPSRPKKL